MGSLFFYLIPPMKFSTVFSRTIFLELLFVFFPISSLLSQPFSEYGAREMRGVWIATAYGIDWPKTTDPEEQQRSLRTIFQDIASKNCNAVFFQVRIRGDILFYSNYEPYSDVLTDTLGKMPSYDPVNYAISLAHEYGLEFHAWFNTMILRGKNRTPTSVGVPHIWQSHPEWIDRRAQINPSQKTAYLNPALPEVHEHLVNLIADFAHRYDVDGIQCDDYLRYPSQFFPDDPEYESQNPHNLSREDWRRENINTFVKTLYDTLMIIKPYLKFGVSPVGVYERVDSEPAMESYRDVYQDSRAWSKAQTCDYLAPQVYFHTGPTRQSDRKIGKFNPPFEKLLEDWSQNKNNRHLYVGLGPYKPSIKAELDAQITLVQRAGAEGMIFYPYHAIADIPRLFPDSVPTPTMPWKSITLPSAPNNIQLFTFNNAPHAFWPKSGQIRWTNIYKITQNRHQLIQSKIWEHKTKINAQSGDTIFFTIIDRYGHESPPSLPMVVP